MVGSDSPSQKAAKSAKWAVTMTKVRIRQIVANKPWPRWQLVTFCGPDGAEARGIVDMIAIRKDHGLPPRGLKRGDPLKIIIVQVKGSTSAVPTEEDAKHLRTVAFRHGVCGMLLATWKKGQAAQFYSLSSKIKTTNWKTLDDVSLNEVFR